MPSPSFICISADPFTPDVILPCDTEEECIAAGAYLRDEGLAAHPVLKGEAPDTVETSLTIYPAEPNPRGGVPAGQFQAIVGGSTIAPITPDEVTPLLPMSEIIDYINKGIRVAWDGRMARLMLKVSISQAQLEGTCAAFRAVGWSVQVITPVMLNFSRA